MDSRECQNACIDCSSVDSSVDYNNINYVTLCYTKV